MPSPTLHLLAWSCYIQLLIIFYYPIFFFLFFNVNSIDSKLKWFTFFIKSEWSKEVKGSNSTKVRRICHSYIQISRIHIFLLSSLSNLQFINYIGILRWNEVYPSLMSLIVSIIIIKLIWSICLVEILFINHICPV